MEIKVTLPDEALEALGPAPEREALEGVVLLLVGEGRLSLERALSSVSGIAGRRRAGMLNAPHIVRLPR